MATGWFKTTSAASPEGLKKFQALCTQSDLGKLSKADFNAQASKLSGIPVGEVEAGIEDQLQVNEGLVEYAKNLINRGFMLACLSNGSHEWTTYAIEKYNLQTLFEEIVISSDLGIVKPDPQIYLHTLKLLSVEPSECIFVDDRSDNTDAAEKLGIRSLIFTETEALKYELEALFIARR